MQIFQKVMEDIRSSRPEVLCYLKGVLWNFSKLVGKHLCQSLFFSKVACLRPATLLKKRLRHSCFPVNFAKFLRIPFLQNTSRRLLLWHCYDCSTVRALIYKFYELLTFFHSEIHCWRITACTRLRTTHDPINIMIGLFWWLNLLVLSYL